MCCSLVPLVVAQHLERWLVRICSLLPSGQRRVLFGGAFACIDEEEYLEGLAPRGANLWKASYQGPVSDVRRGNGYFPGIHCSWKLNSITNV